MLTFSNRTQQVTAFAALLLLACSRRPAVAQMAPDGTAQDSNTLAEVVVTAQHRAESIREVPIAIDAFDANAIRQANYDSIAEVAAQTPGLFYGIGTGQTNPISLRGIGSNRFDSRIDPSVGTFVNEMYLPRFGQSLSYLVDVERIEVLKGPQGTLYGRNTTGGAINIITNRPTQELTGGAEVEVGNKELVSANGFISGPIAGQAITGRLAVGYYDRDGFMKETVSGHTDGVSNKLVRGTLDFTPSEYATISVVSEYLKRHKDSFFFNINSTPTIFQSPTVTAPPLVPGHYQEALSFPGFYDLEQWYVSVKASVDLAPFTLTSISAFQHAHGNYLNDVDSTVLDIAAVQVDENTNAFSQELRIASRPGGLLTLGDALQWIAGIYYLDDKPKELDEFDFGRDSVVYLLARKVPGLSLPISDIFTSNLHKQSIAGFGQLTYHITDELQFTAGGRWTHDEINFAAGGVPSVSGFPLIAGAYSTGGDLKWSSFDPKFTLSYDVHHHALVYASFARGFKSGGVQNLPTTAEAAARPFNPEHVKTTELGLKSTWFDRRLQLDLAAFYTDFADLQVQSLVTLPSGATLTVTDNAGSSTIRGAELEVAALPVRGLRLSLGYAYLHAKYGQFVSGTNDYSGRWLNRSPENTIDVAGVYTIPLASLGEAALRADWFHSSEVFFTPGNLASESQPGYGVVNASVAWTDSAKRWRVSIWGKNLGSTQFITHVFPSQPGFGFLWSDKRTVGLSVARTF
jgi:iron complex outermembrane receptor protein